PRVAPALRERLVAAKPALVALLRSEAQEAIDVAERRAAAPWDQLGRLVETAAVETIACCELFDANPTTSVCRRCAATQRWRAGEAGRGRRGEWCGPVSYPPMPRRELIEMQEARGE